VKTLFDTYEEWHAFIIGFTELIPPWPAKLKPSRATRSYLHLEYHYYRAGRTTAFFVLIALLALLLKIFWR